MASREIQLQWSLDNTFGSVISIGRDLIKAATENNVQILALLACERFGSTLAVCPETCTKIENLVVKTRAPKVLSFLSAVVGYSPTDSASFLIRSLAGTQFLGLAAALITTLGPFHSASAISMMLKNSAVDKTLLPTTIQIKDLLATLEHRCVNCGFLDLVLGYRLMLSKSSALSVEQADKLWKDCTSYPGPVALDKLTDAFRQLSRIGDAQSVTIKTTACAPWVIAFTRWCLNLQPSIHFEDGDPVLSNPGSRVAVICSKDANRFAGVEITIHNEVGSLTELIRTEPNSGVYSGMTSIDKYAQWLLRDCEMSETSMKAFRVALPYALKQAVTNIRFSMFLVGFEKQEADRQKLLASPFPDDATISGILTRFLGAEEQKPLKRLQCGLSIEDLPSVKQHVDDLRKQCCCSVCSGDIDDQFYTRCKRIQFFDNLAMITADILALSLFDDSESLLVHFNHRQSGRHDDSINKSQFKTTVAIVLSSGATPEVGLHAVLYWALSLIGHESDLAMHHRWVISCFFGQAVFPKIFETQILSRKKFLTLSWAPGQLSYEGNTYKLGAFGAIFTGIDRSVPIQQLENAVDRPLNLVPELRPVWRIAAEDDLLTISLGIDDPENKYGFIRTSPFQIILNMGSAIVLEACPHDHNTLLPGSDPFCVYVGPILPKNSHLGRVAKDAEDDRVEVVAVNKNDGLRMFALSCVHFRAVLRGDACLACGLDVCRRFNYPILIC